MELKLHYKIRQMRRYWIASKCARNFNELEFWVEFFIDIYCRHIIVQYRRRQAIQTIKGPVLNPDESAHCIPGFRRANAKEQVVP